MTAGESSLKQPEEQPLLVVLSGPSGVGKDATLNGLRCLDRPWRFVVTATTRPRRPQEVDGVDYLFLETGKFHEMVAGGEFLEHAQVYGNWYGSPRNQVREAMSVGQDIIIKVDVQGAASIKALAPDAVFIFLVASSLEELERRLRARATETGQGLQVRTRIAVQEMDSLQSFDYRVVNRDGCLEDTVACIEAIIRAEKCRVLPRRVTI